MVLEGSEAGPQFLTAECEMPREGLNDMSDTQLEICRAQDTQACEEEDDHSREKRTVRETGTHLKVRVGRKTYQSPSRGLLLWPQEKVWFMRDRSMEI